MRLELLLFIAVTWTNACRPGFTHYEGWCVYTNSKDLEYYEAVNECATLNAFAPSIHNQKDIDFWSKIASSLLLNSVHFWLDCYCPGNELQNCETGVGYHMHGEGMLRYAYEIGAAALCAYEADTPNPSGTTTPVPSTVAPFDVTDGYCLCDPASVYLDIVFVVDASADMTSKTVGDATAAIQSTLLGLTFGTRKFQSNVAVVAFAGQVQTVRSFGSFRSQADIWSFSVPYLGGKAARMAEAISRASTMYTANERSFTRGVIVLMSKSFNQLDSANILEAAEAFKDDGGIFISIDYGKGLGIKGLQNIASSGYYIDDALSRDSLIADMLHAFCDANCFCPEGLLPYNVPDYSGRQLPKGCYHVAEVSAVYTAAEQNCLHQKGFVATIHDATKNFFMISIFPPKSRFWIGLKRNGDGFDWADNSTDPFTDWAPGNPVAGLDCVYKQQEKGFNTHGYSAPCADPLKNSMEYACQLRPCDSEYDCWQ